MTELAHNYAEILRSPYRGEENSAEEPRGFNAPDHALVTYYFFRSSFERLHSM